jgi:hypothetical protein
MTDLPIQTDDDNGPKPNKWGVTVGLSFDRFDDWTWEGQDEIIVTISNISARAARLVIEQIAEDSHFGLMERDDGMAVELWTLDADLVFEADLLGLVREYIKVHDREMDRVTLRRVLTEALALLGPS